MPVLTPNKPLITDEPVITVENRLKAGRYRFRLRVIDDSEQISLADERIVEVSRSQIILTRG